MWRPPVSTRTDTHLPDTTLFRSLLQLRRFRPGICRPDLEGRGRNRWILLNRKGLKRQYPGQNDAKRHDPGKNRPVDEETRSHPLGLTFLLRLGATLGRRLRLGDSDRFARLQLLQARYDDSITSLQPAAHNPVASLQLAQFY